MARTQVAISTDLVGDLFTISVWDIATGNILTSYKSPDRLVVPPRCLDVIRDHYLLTTYATSPVLNVWTLAKKDHLHTKMILPGVVGALAVSSDGAYCLAAIDAKIYIWQLSSGNLLNVLEKHYQKVTTIRLTTDLSRFISAGEDGLVLVWDFARCLVDSDTFTVVGGSSNQYDPIRTINNSSTRINDLHLGEAANGGRGHFAVGSEDCNCKVYCLETGQLLATILFSHPVQSVVMDRSERFLFCGLSNGDICQTALSEWAEAAAAGTSDKVIDLTTNVDVDEEFQTTVIKRPNTFYGHTAAITCLAVTIDGHGLLSGSADKTIKLWHIKSRQSMRTTTFKGTVTNLLVRPAPNGLFVYDSLETQQSLMEPSAQVTADISLASQPSTSKNSHKRQAKSHLAEHSKYNRPITYESMMKRATNPPPPIVAFKREIYRPGKISSMAGGTSLNAFETGVIWVANDTTSGANFWPWNDWAMPEEDDVERIFSVKATSQPSSGLSTTTKARSKRAALTNGDLQGEVDEEGEQFTKESKDETIARLKAQNEQLFKFTIDRIFRNLHQANH